MEKKAKNLPCQREVDSPLAAKTEGFFFYESPRHFVALSPLTRGVNKEILHENSYC